jgi:DNA-binding Lrp family transcriptional regulator
VSKIELDDIDIGILAFLTDMPDKTTFDIAKALFKPPYNLRKLDSFIRYRVKRLIEEGVLKQMKRERKLHYAVDEGKVFFGEGVLKMNGVGEVDMGYFVVVKKEGETVAKSLDDYERRIGRKPK